MSRFRPLVVAVIALAHVGALAVLMTGGGRSPVDAAPAGAIAVREVPSVTPVAVEPTLTLASIAADVTAPDIEIVDARTGETVDAGNGDCAMGGAIVAALARDPAVNTALAASAAAQTAAVMIWDGRWTGDAPAIRRVVVDRIQAASADCRNAAITGPRLLIVPAGATSVAVAVGSGTWRWGELLT